jgi:hypothetical protein
LGEALFGVEFSASYPRQYAQSQSASEHEQPMQRVQTG